MTDERITVERLIALGFRKTDEISGTVTYRLHFDMSRSSVACDVNGESFEWSARYWDDTVFLPGVQKISTLRAVILAVSGEEPTE